jgi:peptidyl-prolyl cis-trans isomerase D
MLDIMRKNASSLLIKIIFSIIVIVFVFWGVGNFQENRGNRVALVNGEEITFDAYRNAYNQYVENLKSQYGNNLSQEILEMFQIPTTVINSLINRELLMQAADDLDIEVTDAELAAAIQSMDVFRQDGAFNTERYVQLLQINDMDQKLFEIDQRESMLIDKLYTYITTGIKVTDGEIREWYEWINASVDIDYATFVPYEINDIEPSEQELIDFYDLNSENYRTQPSVRVRYLVFRPENFTAEATVEDAYVQAYYEGNASEFETEKTVEARHILLSVDENAADDVVDEKLKKAEEILAMAKSGKDFAELAKEYSEGATRETGGLLGEFKEGDMVAPFSEAAFSMAEGELSEPVRTQFGWHLIKVEKVNEASVKPLEAVADQIREQLTEEAAMEMAYEKADEAFDLALSDDDFEKTAASLGMAIQTTDYFTSAGPETGISDPQAFAAAAFGTSGTEISDVINIGGNYYILQKTGELSSEVPDLEVVKERVRSDVITQMQREQALTNAEEFLSAAKVAGSLENAAGTTGIEVKSSGFFKRSDSIPYIGYESEIVTAAFLLSDDNKIADQVFEGSGGYYVVQLRERKSPDTNELESQRETIKSQLISQKQQIVFNDWLETLMAESDITVEEGYLD